jgi:hypothetical protein
MYVKRNPEAQWKSNKYYTTWREGGREILCACVCVCACARVRACVRACSLKYPACNAHEAYFIICGLSASTIFLPIISLTAGFSEKSY